MRGLPAGKISSAHVANFFFGSWIVAYGIPVYILADNAVQFTRKLFAIATLCTILGVKQLQLLITPKSMSKLNSTIVR